MKVLVCGDSWSESWGVNKNESWHCYLDCDVVNVAKSGSSNEEICNQFLKNYNDTFDLIIIGWSGSTRFTRSKPFNNQWQHQFSTVDKSTIDFFKNKSLDDILLNWGENIEKILLTTKKPIIQFSVFGDRPLKIYDSFLKESYLEFLANQQGTFFQYDIPIFEFGWLNKSNYQLTKRFGKRYFNKNWQRACVERESVRPGKYFLPCGHPNQQGHKIWGKFIKEKINSLKTMSLSTTHP